MEPLGPGEVVEQFFAAYAEGDCGRLPGLLYFDDADSSPEDPVAECESLEEDGEDRAAIGESTIGEVYEATDAENARQEEMFASMGSTLPEPEGSNEFASVVVENDFGEGEGYAYTLVRVGEEWRLVESQM